MLSWHGDNVEMTLKFLEGNINPLFGKIESKMSATLCISEPSLVRVSNWMRAGVFMAIWSETML